MRFLVEDQSGPVSINVSQTGVVHALKLGTSRVTAHAVMHDGTVFHCKVSCGLVYLSELSSMFNCLKKSIFHSASDVRCPWACLYGFLCYISAFLYHRIRQVFHILHSLPIYSSSIAISVLSQTFCEANTSFQSVFQNPTVVKVVQLAGIRIDSPLTQYHVGGTVPLHVNGLDDDENPMSFGSAAPGLIFKWESGNPTVVSLRTVHAQVF